MKIRYEKKEKNACNNGMSKYDWIRTLEKYGEREKINHTTQSH